jgi:hypothetical protein
LPPARHQSRELRRGLLSDPHQTTARSVGEQAEHQQPTECARDRVGNKRGVLVEVVDGDRCSPACLLSVLDD